MNHFYKNLLASVSTSFYIDNVECIFLRYLFFANISSANFLVIFSILISSSFTSFNLLILLNNNTSSYIYTVFLVDF